jgi:hypothetical protein
MKILHGCHDKRLMKIFAKVFLEITCSEIIKLLIYYTSLMNIYSH